MGCKSIAGFHHSIKFARTHLYTWVERGTVKVKYLVQEHSAMYMYLARAKKKLDLEMIPQILWPQGTVRVVMTV